MTNGKPAPVTVLGLGPMGRALAGAFLAAGHPTTVWNRTAARAAELAARGAATAPTAAAAAATSPLVIACVLDYAAIHEIVEPAAGALRGRTLVNLTADTPERARWTAGWAAEHGVGYLDGAIMTPVASIGGPGAVVLYSGPEKLYQAHRATLAAIGGTAAHLGADPGRAAAHDVALLDLFWTSMSGLVHAFALARAEGIAARELAPLAKGIGALLPPIIEEYAGHVDEGRHPGDDSTIGSAAAGIRHVIEAAAARGLDTGVLDAAAAVARRAIDAGHGTDGFSLLAETLTGPPAAPRPVPA
ncbi:6-phosphogluconate dehydrogenase [Sphaerisporangium rufum]|uniref:6-phosphogluconate dehydrogenase n=1 Tax=Sphaerisporangium rufum TaxID=1381558 RepID=A0A919R9R4_9ACTN|nr:NAD(P)-binding domain-containing protein [Sphaerisporangium rufum]GII80785.1 6-phosphogluconate dehydrogenase [Sphaerisporangium rufum]